LRRSRHARQQGPCEGCSEVCVQRSHRCLVPWRALVQAEQAFLSHAVQVPVAATINSPGKQVLDFAMPDAADPGLSCPCRLIRRRGSHNSGWRGSGRHALRGMAADWQLFVVRLTPGQVHGDAYAGNSHVIAAWLLSTYLSFPVWMPYARSSKSVHLA
jgi:hypothetical protein